MSRYPCRITIALPPGATEELRDEVEEAFLDHLDEILGDVDETGQAGGRYTVSLILRDLKSGVIAVRRIMANVSGLPNGTELRLSGDGPDRTLPLDGDTL